MLGKFLHKIAKFSLFHLPLLCLLGGFFLPSAAFAVSNQTKEVRNAWVDDNGRCKTERINFNPLGTSEDIMWETDNPTCIGYVLSSGVALFTAAMISSSLCQNAKAQKIHAASMAAGVALSPKMVKDRAKETGKCAALTASCAASLGSSPSCGWAPACCSAAAATAVTMAAAVAALRAIWQASVDSQDNARICGERWNTWESVMPSDDKFPISSHDVDPDRVIHIFGRNKHSYQKLLEEKARNSEIKMTIETQEYREYIYGGIEFMDNGDDACQNPASWDNNIRMEILGYDDSATQEVLGISLDNQRYYMRGPRLASNYACGRFLLGGGTNEQKQDGRAAYECCKERSKNMICIEEKSNISNLVRHTPVGAAALEIDEGLEDKIDSTKYKFCKIGTNCKVQHVWYEIYEAKKTPNYICAKTYSVCPYNHKLGGGTEVADYENINGTEILSNHCQYLKHCSKRPDAPYIRTSNLEGGWISGACFDLKGDSQNSYGYSSDLLPTNQTRNFSAPIAQCFKETMENLFTNKAGRSECNDPDESPNKSGICTVSDNKYTKGQNMEGEVSFFVKIQQNFQTTIKMVITMAIVVMGISMLLGGKIIEKKVLMMFIIKLALVFYFALGSAWQSHFFSGVSSSSIFLANMFNRVDDGLPDNKKDGCQFPKYNYADHNPETKYDNPAYPPGKQYLEVWDMLDCKISKSMGYGPEASIPNLLLIIAASIVSSGIGFLGLVLFIATFIFAFFLLALTVRALHIFLMSSIAIAIMVYVSPFTITAALFKRTEGIFKKWRSQLTGFVLQPIILFAYLGIFIAIFDIMIIGDAVFYGAATDTLRRIDCSVGNASTNSLYCIFFSKDIGFDNSLAPLGLSIPILYGMNKAKLFTIVKAAFLMFIFAKFIDQIAEITKRIVGGNPLPSSSTDGMKALGKAFGAADGIRQRGFRGGAKAAKGLTGFAEKQTRGVRGAIANKASATANKIKTMTKSGGETIASRSLKVAKKADNALGRQINKAENLMTKKKGNKSRVDD